MPGKRSMAEAGGRAPRRRVAPGLTTDRRSRHNAVERKRQQQLSSYISELGEFLEEHGIEVRRDKVSILTSLLKFLNGEDGWSGAKEEPANDKFPLAKVVDFSALFAFHTSPMLVTEPHGRVVACNEAFCHTFQTTNEVVTRGAAALNLLHAPSSEEFHATLSSIASLTGHRGHDVAIGEPSKPRFGESMDVQRTLVVPTQHGSYMEAPVTMRLFVIPAAGSSARSEEERKMRAAGVANAPEAVPTNVHIACVLYGAADPTAWKGGSAAPAQPTEAEVAPGTESLSAAEQAPVPAPASTASYTAAAAPVTSSAPQGPPLPAGYYPGFGVSEAGMYGTSPSAVAFHHAGLAARGGHPPYGAEYPVPGAQAPRPPALAPYPFAMGMGQAPQVSRSMPGWPGQGALPVGHQPYLQHQPQPQPQAHPQLEGALDGEPPRRDAGPPPPTAMHA